MSEEIRHELHEPVKLSYPGGKNGYWVIRCECDYTTGARVSLASANRSAIQHLVASTCPACHAALDDDMTTCFEGGWPGTDYPPGNGHGYCATYRRKWTPEESAARA